MHHCHIDVRTTELYSSWQKRDEGVIKILKSKAECRIIIRRVPKRVWDFGIVFEAEIYSSTTVNYVQTPMEIFTGDTIDI